MSDAIKTNNSGKLGSIIGDPRDVLIALGVILVMMLIVVPLPTVLLDAFTALNLVLSLLILLTVLYTKKATDFSLFPTVLLVVTVFSLALNISSTRLILTKGSTFDGRMIRAFSTFVVGSGDTSGLVVGFIIFIVIIAVQVVVITKGASRVSEVAARFTLDALPGKQMAIEAEMNSGAINEEEARKRKAELQQEVDFYGAMDGASKFISGNVKVGIFIVVINVIGGIIIGTLIHGEPIGMAVATYVAFTVGDGLLSQFPALLVSTAMGIVVTRAASPGSIGETVSEQFSRDSRIYWICAIVLFGFAILPGFPWYVLIPMGVLIAYYANAINKKHRKKAQFDAMMAQKNTEIKKTKEENAEMSPIQPLDALSLEIGYALIPLVEKEKGAELLERIKNTRSESALKLGLVIPKIRIQDNMGIGHDEYHFKIRGVCVGKGRIRTGHYMCMNPGNVREELQGEKTTDPAFGIPAIWVHESMRNDAEKAGYTVVDPPTIIATHMTEIIKKNAAEILGRQETQAILDTMKKDYPALVDEVKNSLSLGDVQKVLQGLLKEQVSIRNMVSILEALADFGQLARGDIYMLTEKVRQALRREICHKYADDELKLRVLLIDQQLEEQIIESRHVTNSGIVMSALKPEVREAFVKSLHRSLPVMREYNWEPIILCRSEVARYLIKTVAEMEQKLPNLVVLSYQEIVNDVTLEIVGGITLEH